MICPNCGFDNSSGSFCGKCGAPLAVQTAPIYQPPAPKPKSKKMLIVAIVAIVVVVAVVLAAVMFVLPKAAQSTPDSALNTYIDGAKNHDAAKIVDSTILHFDTMNRSLLMSGFNSTWTNTITNITILSTEEISMVSVPTDIKLDVTNFTNAIQKAYSITIQESQFVKVTIKQTNSSTDSYSSTSYILLSKVDGKWYLDIYANYSTADWAADRSMADRGYSPLPGSGTGSSTTPTGSFAGMNSSGYRILTIVSISSSNLSYDDCEVRLTIGSHASYPVAIPSSMHLTIPVIAGTATGYSLTITDSGTSGYVSPGDLFTLGPFNTASGLNAVQPTGTVVVLSLIYAHTGETIATATFTL